MDRSPQGTTLCGAHLTEGKVPPQGHRSPGVGSHSALPPVLSGVGTMNPRHEAALAASVPSIPSSAWLTGRKASLNPTQRVRGTQSGGTALPASSALPVLEEAQGFMGPDSDKPFHRQGLQRPQGLEDAPHPPRHLTGRVDVVGLCVLGEPLLWEPGKRSYR